MHTGRQPLLQLPCRRVTPSPSVEYDTLAGTGLRQLGYGDVAAYRLQLFQRDRLDAVGKVRCLEDLAAMDEAGAGKSDARVTALGSIESVKLSLSDRLLDIVLADGALRDGLERLGRLRGGGPDSKGRARDLDRKEACVGVGEVAGCYAGTARGRALG